MTIFVFANNVDTALAGGISSASTSITVSSTLNLPTSIASGSYLALTLNDQATRTNYEIVYVTAITGATLTVLRAQEGTAAKAWLTGDFVFSGPTAGQMSNFSQSAATGVTPGSYGSSTQVGVFTVNAQGQVTAASNVAIAFPITSFNGRSGAITLSAGDVTTALGYTPAPTNGPTFTGLATFNDAYATNLAATINNPAGALLVQAGISGSTTGPAYINIIRQGSYGANIGIDTDNQWKVGGGSMSGAAYRIVHEGLSAVSLPGSLTTAGALAGSNFSGSSSGTNTGDQTSVSGNAGTATKLATARTVALTGVVSGSASFDGSANISISTSQTTLLPLSGGTLTGPVTFSTDDNTFSSTAPIKFTGTGTSGTIYFHGYSGSGDNMVSITRNGSSNYQWSFFGTLSSTGTVSFNTSDESLKDQIDRNAEPQPLHKIAPFTTYRRTDTGQFGRGPIAQDMRKAQPLYVNEYLHPMPDGTQEKKLGMGTAAAALEEAWWCGRQIDQLIDRISALESSL